MQSQDRHRNLADESTRTMLIVVSHLGQRIQIWLIETLYLATKDSPARRCSTYRGHALGILDTDGRNRYL